VVTLHEQPLPLPHMWLQRSKQVTAQYKCHLLPKYKMLDSNDSYKTLTGGPYKPSKLPEVN
jgi:hypothetical protein